MLAGNSEKAAEIISSQLGITEFDVQVLPEEKHGMIEKLKADGRRVVMVGDGINDVPALAAANISAGRKVLACVWVFHIIYFAFGVKNCE